METTAFTDTTFYTWVLLPFLIFSARIVDVTLGTLRVIFITRGMKYLSALVGFLEILIWLLAIGQIFKNLDNVVCYLVFWILEMNPVNGTESHLSPDGFEHAFII